MQPMERPFDDFDAVIRRVETVPGVSFAIPVVEGQVMAKGNVGAGTGVLVRGIAEEDISQASTQVCNQCAPEARFRGSTRSAALRSARGMARATWSWARR